MYELLNRKYEIVLRYAIKYLKKEQLDKMNLEVHRMFDCKAINF